MKNKKLTSLVIAVSTLISVGLIADEVDHDKMDHTKHMMQMGGETKQAVVPTAATAKFPTKTSPASTSSATPLKEAGNAIFGTIQETIKMLDADPKTDWEKVDLEGLRQHLIDMENFTSGVDVLSNDKIEKGSKIVIRAKSKEAHFSLERALKAHPSMMQSETGWTMDVKQNKEQFTLTIETQKPEEVARLRALGYIGVMALGDHHQVHHWLMASGSNPHGGHASH
jgi:high-affinity K+ transport system ATPase subunit B